MIEKISALKNKAIERVNYYSTIGFFNLANEFTEFVNILNEMENIVKEKEELKAQIQLYQEETQRKRAEARAAQDAEVND